MNSSLCAEKNLFLNSSCTLPSRCIVLLKIELQICSNHYTKTGNDAICAPCKCDQTGTFKCQLNVTEKRCFLVFFFVPIHKCNFFLFAPRAVSSSFNYLFSLFYLSSTHAYVWLLCVACRLYYCSAKTLKTCFKSLCAVRLELKLLLNV